MRTVWFRGVTLAGAALLALAMLGLNIAFEVAGSVPDMEGCGFLAGHLGALLALYPLAAGLIAARAARLLLERYPEEDDAALRCGGRIGLGGAGLYFLIGLLLLPLRSPVSAPPPSLWGLLALYLLLSAFGGRAGAILALEKGRALAWRSEQH